MVSAIFVLGKGRLLIKMAKFWGIIIFMFVFYKIYTYLVNVYWQLIYLFLYLVHKIYQKQTNMHDYFAKYFLKNEHTLK